MAIHMIGNYMLVQPGQKHFLIASNFTNYFEIGAKGLTKYYLEARIEDNNFVINGRVYVPDCEDWCEITNNLPSRGPCRKVVLTNGYRIQDQSGNTVLEMLVSQNGPAMQRHRDDFRRTRRSRS